MKNEILDDFHIEKIHRLLDKNEKVIWDGHPIADFNWMSINSYKDFQSRLLLVSIGLLLLFIIIALFFIFSWQGIIFTILLVFGISFKRIVMLIEKKNVRYIITERRIVFQLPSLWQKRYYAIPFSVIKNLVVTNDFENIGVIYLVVKTPEAIHFETFNLNSGDLRHQPTLEMIENVEEVAEYIKLGIQGKL